MPRIVTTCAQLIILTVLLSTGWNSDTQAARGTTNPPKEDAFTRRVVKTFTFDEKSLGNLEDLPMDWEKVTLSGFPHFVNGNLDDEVGFPKPSFKLQLNGGNLGYVFSERVIPVFPGSDHKIVAYVKTQNLVYARGYLQAFYMDRAGKPLTDTIVYSPLIGPPAPEDPEWRPVVVELPYTNNNGRFIGIGVFLVQQDRLPVALASPVKSYRKDINTALWLDEVTVLRLPKTRLGMVKNTCLYHTSDNVTVGATVADAGTNDLSARIIIQDLATGQARTIAHPVAVLPPLEAILRGHATAPGIIQHEIGRLKPGLYRISLQALTNGDVIIDKILHIAVLNDDRTSELTRHFGIDLSDAEIAQPVLTADFAGTLKPAWAALPIWRNDTPTNRGHAEESPVDRTILELDHRGISILGSFLDVPEELASRCNIVNPSLWDFLAGKPEWWQSELSILVSRHADRIDHWTFGRTTNFWQTPDARIQPVLNSVRKEFSQFQGQFSLLSAWPAMVQPPAQLPADGCFVTIPSELLPGSFEEYFKRWITDPRLAWIVLQEQDLDQYSLEPALVDFARRFIEAKRCRMQNLAARNLWTGRRPNAPGGIEPNAYYVVYANLIDRLDGLDYINSVEIDQGRFGLRFSSADHTVLVLSSTDPKPYRGMASLGEQVKAYDLWGRTLPLQNNEGGWQVPYRPIVFLDNVEADLARFLASIRFDPELVPSKFGTHQVRLVFQNTFSQGINGIVRLQGPTDWQFDPSGSRFALPAGKDFTLPMKLRFPSNESIGRKSINVRFELEARKLMRLNLSLPLRIGVSDLDMRVIWFLRGQEMILWQEVQNKGDKWTDLRAFVVAPERPRMERQIRRLGPGQTAVKEYSLGPWKDMFRKTIRVGFQEVRGTRLANEVITLE